MTCIAASYLNSQNICLPLIGIFLRFAPAQSETLIAHTTAQGPFAANEAGMFFEMPVVLPKQMTCSDQRRYEEKYNVLANQLVTQFGGRAHWGKNRASLFQEQRRDGTYGDNLKDFRDIVRQFDPSGMFANRYGYDLGLRWPDRPALPDTDSAAYACIPD